jgi:hypothetical protein
MDRTLVFRRTLKARLLQAAVAAVPVAAVAAYGACSSG